MKYTIATAATLLVVALLGTGSYAAPGPQSSEPLHVICPGIVLKCTPPDNIVETPKGCLACGTPYTL
ncbi:uncharacterized protein LACBIDRAFT_297959 [Laccaria bicolor S238N-H82]|uniref:Predicted protein n=1 Tax=Laccaria bicolor (strain S238N-H82 / ATCC MYA-4686) TaxID=486041 RepID=B0DBX8_LACBS|nr:uncharacterized protein LACBIDRAFT_297959 [Laccaria bicolor S238N-H82]EDR07637.1 predicted protein [Laccaria bicolor S238N-H82]|eukprot:XP_001881426.1 predicted protein [Laccaria bicolor S238N-H82]